MNHKKNYKKILKLTGRAIEQYQLIQEGDRIMLALSGGKDSLSLLHVLLDLQKKAPVSFSLFAYNLDQGQPDFETKELKKYIASLNIEHYFEKQDTYSLVKEKTKAGDFHCSLCARFRRGILYTEANRLQANKIALGHHCDDAIETLLLNLFYSGRLAAMAPILKSDDQKNIVIRPFIFVEEQAIIDFANFMNFPIVGCGSCLVNVNKQRARMKAWVQSKTNENPVLRSSIKKALSNIQPRHLWDKNFFEFDKL